MTATPPPDALQALERSVERLTGYSATTVRNQTIDGLQAEVEARTGRRLQVVNYFPFVGRGNVLGDRLVAHEDVERALDTVLG